MTKEQRALSSFPKLYKPGVNRFITALIKTWAQEDEAITVQLAEAKNEIYVNLADGNFLDALGSNVGINRPSVFPTSDTQFRSLIPVLSYYPKQIRKTIYDLFDIYWGKAFSRSTLTAQNMATYSIYDNDTLTLKIDDVEYTITFKDEDFVDPLAATLTEIITKIDSYNYPLVAQVYTSVDGGEFLRLSTATVGGGGSIEITGGTANGVFDFYDNVKIQNTKCAVYEINPKELIIKIPDSIPLIMGLEGCHHLHENSDLYDTYPATFSDPYWPGSFLYPSPITGINYSISSILTSLNQDIQAGDVYTHLDVIDSSTFPNTEGFLVIDFGMENQEELIPYQSVLSTNRINISPGYVFQHNHDSGAYVNICTEGAVVPRIDGADYPIFLNNTAVAEQLMIDLLYYIKAAGIILKFVVGNLIVSIAEFGPLVKPGYLGDPVMTEAQVLAMIATYGAGDGGRKWFNSTTGQFEGWNGTARVIRG